MAIKLEELKVGMADKVAEKVVDIFIRESEVLEMLPFDDTVSPSGGSTLTYSYMQKKLPSSAAFRALNTEYEANQASLEKKSADLKIFGGSFEIDRVINSAEGKYNNMQYQIEEKIRAAVGTFHNAMLNGDSSSNASSFDGLDKFLVGQSTEFGANTIIDLSNAETIKKNADAFYEALLTLINKTRADALFVNEGVKTKIQTVARILGYKTESEEAFGRVVTTIGENKVRIIDLGNVYGVNSGNITETPIVATKTRDIGGNKTGLTDIYAAHFSIEDGFHGATITGDRAIKTYLPDFTKPGAVKKGEVEMVAAVALKNVKSAGVLRNVKII